MFKAVIKIQDPVLADCHCWYSHRLLATALKALRNSLEESSDISVLVHFSLVPVSLLSDFYLQTHRRLPEVLGLLVKHGSMNIDPSLQSSLANKQYVDALCQAANGRVSPGGSDW